MTQDIYRDLQERLDLYSVGFPPTSSGVELKILKKLFSEDDASVFLKLTHLLEVPEAVAGRLGMSVSETEEKLSDMAGRGLLFSKKKENKTLYGGTPFVHGIFEYQTTRIEPEFAELMEQYGTEAFEQAISKSAGSFLRIIPVQEAIEVENRVAAYDDAIEIIRSKKTIVVADCVCRKVSSTLDQGCGKILEACILFDSMAEYYIEHNLGRQITVDEAIEIQKEGQKQGLVTQPATAQNPAGMCLCCGDCCGILRAVNSHPKPAEVVSSNHYAVLDSSTCTGCKVCVKRCQTSAFSMDENEIAVLNADRCIGCGLCITTCPGKSLSLVVKPKRKQYKLPSDSMDQMLAMAKKRMAFNPKFAIGNTIIQMKIMYRMLVKQLGRVKS